MRGEMTSGREACTELSPRRFAKCRVLNDELDTQSSKLTHGHAIFLADVDVFNRQEANHYKVHAAYNRFLFEQYPGLEAFDAEGSVPKKTADQNVYVTF